MDDKDELRRRRQAIRLWLRGVSPILILQRVERGHSWLAKWRTRFLRRGAAGLRTQSRRPHRLAKAVPVPIRRLIARTRRRLARQRVGLIGPRAIQTELRTSGLGKNLPSMATIKRVLRELGLSTPQPSDKPVYRPLPLAHVGGCLHAMDWTCRYLDGGAKVYAFHTLNLRTRAGAQTIASDKTTATVGQHALETWKTLGIPDFLQLDNDSAFNGGNKVPRVFGQFVRLALYLGIELIFVPPGEPKCNGIIEQFNGLWARAFFERRRFRSVATCARASLGFMHWYHTGYTPPRLGTTTPQSAQQAERPRRLPKRQIAVLPKRLPITAGRVHFIRRVDAEGCITLLNETWRVGKRWAGRYIWATLTTHSRRLDIWYQRSSRSSWHWLRSFAYPLSETVAHRNPAFRR